MILLQYCIYVLFLILDIIILSIIVIQDGRTALMYASHYGYLPVVEYLLQQGAAVDVQNKVRNSISSMYYLDCILFYYNC